MTTLTIGLNPHPLTLSPRGEPQLGYLLLSIEAHGDGGARPVNWALIADASRSMRIPIVDEAQFRALIRDGGAQEMLVDGVPVWQLSSPAPQQVRSSATSALDQVAHALHSVVERLDSQDRFALIACAEEAVLLTRSTSGERRVDLVRGISRLSSLNLGEQTDLAHGIELGLNELRQGRDERRAERLLLLTDGFTQRPEICLQLADAAASEGVAISTIGLGGEFQEDVLTALADRSGGRAAFLRTPADIPQVIAAELSAARAVAARAVDLRVAPEGGAALRRVTRIRPALASLYEDRAPERVPAAPPAIHLGDLAAERPVTLLLEFLAPAHGTGRAPLGRIALSAHGAPATEAALFVTYRAGAPAPPAAVFDAAARASAARLQRRALAAIAAGTPAEAVRLLRAAAARFADLGERALAADTEAQAAALERTGRAAALDAKQLTYATRRLGEE